MTNEYKQLFLQILERYRLGKASADEMTFLEKYYNIFDANDDVVLTEEEYLKVKSVIKARIDHQIEQLSRNKVTKKLWPSWLKYAAAAAVLLVVSTSVLIFKNNQNNGSFALFAPDDIEPGGHRAILTLSNGKKIVLDAVKTGEIASQSGITVTKTKDGQLVYTVVDNGNDQSSPETNTITTPNGGNYQVSLPDGTNVILNAASSLTFPTRTRGNFRWRGLFRGNKKC
jgi:transmembrane sensor